LRIDKALPFAAPKFDESLLVDRETKGVANVVVWLDPRKSAMPLVVHPDLEKVPLEPVETNLRNGRFEPRITFVRTERALQFHNFDGVGHNLRGDLYYNSLNELLPANHVLQRVFSKNEMRPMRLADSIHPWMVGWLFVRDNPYVAISSTNGKLRIKNLPVGTHTFVSWHEVAGFLYDAKRDGKPATIKGRMTIEIKPGDNDVGEILIKPSRP
jgi:hypothetical protein